MIKKHFADGLLHLALVLSLLKSNLNLNNFINSQNHDNLQDIILGPLSGYTQTHTPLTWHSTGYIHQKNYDSYIESVFNDLHSLSYYRRFDGVSTDVGAWLVSTPLLHNSPAAAAVVPQNNQDTGTENPNIEDSNLQAAQVHQVENDNNIAQSLDSNHNAGVVEINSALVVNEPLYPGSLLTKEDLELIEILWKQDIDLGVTRDMYDVSLRKELEKERELELQKEREQDGTNKEEQGDASEDADPHSFMVDGETGELVPTPGNHTTPQEPVLQNGTGLDESDGLSVEEAMRLLEEQIEKTDDQAPVFNASNMQEQMESMIQTAQEYNQMTNHSSNYQRQDSYEQRWQELSTLLQIPDPATSNHSYTQPQNFSMDNNTSNPLMHNASLVPTSFHAANNFGPLDPNALTPSQDAVVNNNISDPITDSDLFNLANQNFQLPEEVSMNQTTENFLDQLLAEEDLMNMMDITPAIGFPTEAQTMDDVSSDSAVSSLGAAASIQDVDDVFSNYASSEPASPLDALDNAGGATGMSYEASERKSSSNYQQFDSSYDQSYRSSSVSSNQSGDYNDSSFADPHHVKHNHSYPLQPGQQPKERKDKKDKSEFSSRDQKRIQQMKLPFGIEDIINTPVEEFNEMVRKYPLSDSQLQLIRDIRRRGKNKVAAHNCRKRKLDVITTLEDEMLALQREKDKLIRERAEIDKQRNLMQDKYNHLYNEVFSSLRDDNGHPYNPNEYSLQQTGDGNVFLVPRNSSSSAADEHKEKTGRKRKGRK